MISGAAKSSSAKARFSPANSTDRSRSVPLHTRKKPPIKADPEPTRHRLCTAREAAPSAKRPVIDDWSDLGARTKVSDPAKTAAILQPDRTVFGFAARLVVVS